LEIKRSFINGISMEPEPEMIVGIGTDLRTAG
jgi:hypothetical protein